MIWVDANQEFRVLDGQHTFGRGSNGVLPNAIVARNQARQTPRR